jgi:hypothetical protein
MKASCGFSAECLAVNSRTKIAPSSSVGLVAAYLMASSLSIAAVNPASETGMVTGFRVMASIPMLRLVPAFNAVITSGVSGEAA